MQSTSPESPQPATRATLPLQSLVPRCCTQAYLFVLPSSRALDISGNPNIAVLPDTLTLLGKLTCVG